MYIEILRGELERLFSLDELTALCRDILGIDPEQVGGMTARASFARALTERCVETDAIDALVEAIVASRGDADPRLRRLSFLGEDESFVPGSTVGPFTIVRQLGEGGVGMVYQAEREGSAFRLKILRAEAVRDKRALHRFMTLTRLLGQVAHGSLPESVTTGTVASGYLHYFAHRYQEGETLAERIAHGGPLQLGEARPVLRSVLGGLSALHERRLAHGNLKAENVLITRGGFDALLLDAALDRLRLRTQMLNGHAELLATLGASKTVAPEQIRGSLPDARSDVYSFGAVLYELLTGKPPFPANSAVDSAIAHLTEEPPLPSSVAPRGFIPRELDALVMALLEKEASDRPADARAVLEALERIGREQPSVSTVDDEEFDARVYAVLSAPEDDAAALRLEAAIEEGVDPTRVAEAFAMAVSQLEMGDAGSSTEVRRALLFRAGRIFDNAHDKDRADEVYTRLLELDDTDDVAIMALVRLRKSAEKFEEAIELLLSRSDSSESGAHKARMLAEIGQIYAVDLEDRGQAVVAYAQAFCEDPETAEYANHVERLSAGDLEHWQTAASMCADAANGDIPQESKNRILARLGKWYTEKLSRLDLALSCYQAVGKTDPSNPDALLGMTTVYQKAQQWSELSALLLHRARFAPSPTLARNLMAQAASVLESKMSDIARARELYEQIIADDPSHPAAGDGLGRIYEALSDAEGLCTLLDRRAEGVRGKERLSILCRIAEVYEDRRNDLGEATKRYEEVLEQDPHHLDALKGLDRIYNRTGKYHQLLDVLDKQLQGAATPRQKVGIYERIASVYDEEFLDHEKAAEACEELLALDPSHESALQSLVRHYRTLEQWANVESTYNRMLKYASEPARQIELGLALARVLSEELRTPELAMATYEKVLALEPNHPVALEALSRLRESSGDAQAALDAIESLASQATSKEAKAEHWVRGARLLETRGDLDGAILRYKEALDCNPDDPQIAESLRKTYVARGNAQAAVDLLAREIERTTGALQKSRLLSHMARLCKDHLDELERARTAATQAIALDPTNVEALAVLGDIAFEEGRYLEAAAHLELPAYRADTMEKEVAVRALVRYVDALSQTGGTERSLTALDVLLRIAPDDHDALSRIAEVTFDHGEPARAYDLYRQIIGSFRDRMDTHELSAALYRQGESARRAGRLKEAFAALSESIELNPHATDPLTALAKIYETQEDWESVIKLKSRHLDVAEGEERYGLLIEMGETFATKLHDRTRAAKAYIAALEDKPDDRNLLTRLMQLYSEEKDWSKLLEVVLKLAEFVEEPAQRAKYLQTAGMVSEKQLGDVASAIGYYERAIELDPSLEKSLEQAVALRAQGRDHLGVEKLLKVRLSRALGEADEPKMLETFEKLARLYEKDLGWIDRAIDAYEAAQTLEPDNKERNDGLASLYASDPGRYLEKAVHAHRAILARNPNRTDSYKLLRRLYTEAKRADAAFCMCQALYLMNQASPDEERFFKRMRPEGPAEARASLQESDFLQLLAHPEVDPLVSGIFALIEPAIIAARASTLESLGYHPEHQVRLTEHPSIVAQTLFYAAGVLGTEAPPTFENTNDMGGVSFLHVKVPSVVLGRGALDAHVPPQAAAFVAARHLAFYRPGFYVRQMLATGTGMKAWLFGAIKLIAPQFPVQADLEGPVTEAHRALESSIAGPLRERLASLVSKLLQAGGALDLKRWVAGVDLSADRAGFVVANDLQVAGEIIKASGEDASSVSIKDRLKELVLYATSEEYFALREKLGIAVDS